MKRWTKILLAVVGLVGAMLALIPVFVNANTFRPTIEKQLTTTLGRTVKLGHLSLSPFSGNLVARDLSVADDPAFSTTPFLTARALQIGVLLRPLIFSHEINLRSFLIESPQINVIRAANGTWNFSSIGHRTAASSPTNGGPANPSSVTPKASLPALPELSVGRISIDDGRVVVTMQPSHGAPGVYEHVNFVAHDFSFASQFPFELNTDLPAGGTVSATGRAGPLNRDDAATTPAAAQIEVKHLDPVGAGFLNPNAGVSLLADADLHAGSDGQTLITSGTAHIENLKLRKGATSAARPFDVTYSGTHRLRENSGEIQDATVRIGGAALHASGTYEPVALGAEDPQLNLKLGGQGLPIDDLQALMNAAAVRLPNGSVLKGGTLSMSLAIAGQAKSLVISGPIALDDTRLVGFDIDSKIHGIAALSGVKTKDTVEFEKLRVTVRITNAGVVVDKVDAVIPSMGQLTGSGTISAADQLDFNLVAKVSSAKGIGKVGVGLLTMLNGSSGASGVPLRVTGTPDDPYITADVSGAVQKKTKSIFGKKK